MINFFKKLLIALALPIMLTTSVMAQTGDSVCVNGNIFVDKELVETKGYVETDVFSKEDLNGFLASKSYPLLTGDFLFAIVYDHPETDQSVVGYYDTIGCTVSAEMIPDAVVRATRDYLRGN
jgi:hypothetical protein